jgi:hypothetical protein
MSFVSERAGRQLDRRRSGIRGYRIGAQIGFTLDAKRDHDWAAESDWTRAGPTRQRSRMRQATLGQCWFDDHQGSRCPFSHRCRHFRCRRVWTYPIKSVVIDFPPPVAARVQSKPHAKPFANANGT